MTIDIREHPGIIEAINAIINNGGIAEIKTETRNAMTSVSVSLTVVEQFRRIKEMEDVTSKIERRQSAQ